MKNEPNEISFIHYELLKECQTSQVALNEITVICFMHLIQKFFMGLTCHDGNEVHFSCCCLAASVSPQRSCIVIALFQESLRKIVIFLFYIPCVSLYSFPNIPPHPMHYPGHFVKNKNYGCHKTATNEC